MVDNFTIEGHVDILINIKSEDAKNITLHVHQIQVYENLARVYGQDGTEKTIEGFGYDLARQFFVIFLK